MTCLRGWCASLGGVGCMLTWVVWVACLYGCHGWCVKIGKVVGVLVKVAWVAYQSE